MDATTIAYIGVFVGVLLRTSLPYLRKLKEIEGSDKELKFDMKYIATAVFSLVISLIVSLLVFPSFEIPAVADIYVFVQAFAFGWFTNDIINEVIA